MRRLRDEGGQILAFVIVILLIASTLVPLMVMFSQRESVWTARQAASTTAFHLAEAGIEKAYLALSQSTQTWVDLQAGTPPPGYAYDTKWSDLSGGYYTISITSGPDSGEATIISVGKDSRDREVRAIKAVYANSPLGGIAIYATGGMGVSNKVQLEWGAGMSPQNIALTGADTTAHPQFWSAGSIDVFDTSPTPPNCDSPSCCQWHTYATNLPPSPILDFEFYKSSATLSSCAGVGTGADPVSSCYYPSSQTNWDYTLSGKTIYINGNLNIKSGGVFITGNTFVMGNVTLPNGVWGKGTKTMSVPQDAWKQYCNDWNYYRTTYDGAAPATFPGLNSDYQSAANLTYTSTKISFSGLTYVLGNFNNGGGGGGNTDMHGVLYTVGTSTLAANSPIVFFYDAQSARSIQTTQIVLSRVSWQDHLVPWPSGL